MIIEPEAIVVLEPVPGVESRAKDDIGPGAFVAVEDAAVVELGYENEDDPVAETTAVVEMDLVNEVKPTMLVVGLAVVLLVSTVREELA